MLQHVESVNRAVDLFEARGPFDAQQIRRNAERFRPERFRAEFQAIMETAYSAFQHGENPERAVMGLAGIGVGEGTG
ncbi:hypothetical protein [Deinococcus apachensis]|uniref:hypothetical protein n=1 Tax=Deinococcus apachensis TaxID=309886 RepID=UPI0003821617|nr:hypothetical protein [Deinococcus apachensis]